MSHSQASEYPSASTWTPFSSTTTLLIADLRLPRGRDAIANTAGLSELQRLLNEGETLIGIARAPRVRVISAFDDPQEAATFAQQVMLFHCVGSMRHLLHVEFALDEQLQVQFESFHARVMASAGPEGRA